VHRWRLGGPDPLDGISAYVRTEPVPHWHYISYGMSELYEKESDNPEQSGWGFEFTFRLARNPADHEIPLWPANLMQNLARYVFQSGNWFGLVTTSTPMAYSRDSTRFLDPHARVRARP